MDARDCHNDRFRGLRGLVACMAVAAFLSAHPAQGQRLRVGNPANGYFGGIIEVGRIANTSVAQRFTPAPYQPAGVATGRTPAGRAIRGLTFQGRMAGTSGPVRNPYTSSILKDVRTGWLQQLAPGGAARFFDPRVYTPGRRQRRRIGAQPVGQLIFEPERLLMAMGGLAPAFSGSFSYGGPRDRLSEKDRMDLPRFTISQPPPAEYRSQADLLELRLVGMRTETLEKAWSYFGAGDYLRARSAFQSAEMLDRDDPQLAAASLNRVLQFIAPPVTEMSAIGIDQTTGPDAHLDPELVKFLDQIIDSARSGTVGAVGLLLLIFISIQLLTSIEKTFNEIWGVQRGRSWFQRIVFYWTFISLGAVLGFTSVTLLSAATLAHLFDLLPYGAQLLIWFAPLLSFLIVIALLVAFYRFIPNTAVHWRPALAGAFFVACLLFLNNYFSYIYVQRVITHQSLYGSLGIIPVLMIGLYIFWFFILIGGQ
ncbi:MAG: YihY/virulence factor BrkB family protein, partial [Planctomycetes bacterium]|nr:YihY/virulence factor BrkB family protein [Planctomycetota bacterium]